MGAKELASERENIFSQSLRANWAPSIFIMQNKMALYLLLILILAHFQLLAFFGGPTDHIVQHKFSLRAPPPNDYVLCAMRYALSAIR